MKAQKNTFPIVMKSTALISAAAAAVCTVLFRLYPKGWLLSAAITFWTTCYHFSMRLLVGLIIPKLFAGADPSHRWFQPKAFEEPLYRRLKVKKWKKHVPTYAPESFSTELPLSRIVQTMCISELVHSFIVLFSFMPLLFSIPFGAFSVFGITSVLAAAIDCVFIVVQRYNRPRVIRLLAKRSAYHE